MPFTTVIIHWTGPYNLPQLKDEENREKGNGIYLLTGRCNYERASQLQYCGITKRAFHARFDDSDHHIKEIRDSTLGIWLGEVVYPKPFKRPLLEVAEHCFVHFSAIKLNKAKLSRPQHAVCFISQWFTRDGKPRLHRPAVFRDLPDILWWDEERWRTGRLQIWPVELAD